MSHESVSPADRGDGPGTTPGTQPLSAQYDRGNPAIPIDSLFRALSDPQRRRVLKVLADRPETEMDVETLRDAVAEGDGDTEDGEQRRRVAASLETHLQTLSDLDLVEYDEAAGVVTYRKNPRVTELLSYAKLVENLHDID